MNKEWLDYFGQYADVACLVYNSGNYIERTPPTPHGGPVQFYSMKAETDHVFKRPDYTTRFRWHDGATSEQVKSALLEVGHISA